MAYSGPFKKRDFHYRGKTWIDDVQYVYRQERPWRKPLPYYTCIGTYGGYGNGYWAYVGVQNLASTAFVNSNVDVIAFDRLQSKLGEHANVALTALDLPKSLTMIANRTLQLTKAVRALRKGRVDEMLIALGRDPAEQRKIDAYSNSRKTKRFELGRKRARSKKLDKRALANPANTWLEYTFGWVPLVQDIYQAVQVLQQDFGFTKVRARASAQVPYFYEDGGVEASARLVRYSITTGCEVRIDNPNLFLANQLGLVNPAAVVWDAIPFSFVVDWFVPVTKFLNSLTADVGLELENGYYSQRLSVQGYRNIFKDNGVITPSSPRGHGNFEEFRRIPKSLPTPGLLRRARVPNMNPWLAATSTSLLVQQLVGLKNSPKSVFQPILAKSS